MGRSRVGTNEGNLRAGLPRTIRSVRERAIMRGMPESLRGIDAHSVNTKRCMKRLWSITLALAIPSFCALAQEQGGKGGDVPPLTIENVTVVGKRVVVLPAARKGEVLDTTLYLLPPGDTLMFGSRVSNAAGAGGLLPTYTEFTSPAHFGFEASLGTLLSPRALVHGEYIRRAYDIAGVVDYRGISAYVPGAEASSLLIGLHGGISFGGDDPVLGRARASASFERIGDSYNLFGLIQGSSGSSSFIERGRTATSFGAALASQQGGTVDYDVHFRLTSVSVRDVGDSTREATATTPNIGFLAGFRIDSVHASLQAEYVTTSLQYGTPTQTPSLFSIRGTGEWRPGPAFLLTGGLLYAGGQSSDSGSTTLVMPFASMRYDLSRTASLFAAFSPELRPPSYRDRIMSAPYVDREILLRPEKVNVALSAGARLALDPVTVEGRFFYRTAENTPVVVALDSTQIGLLRYQYVDSRVLGLAASLNWPVSAALTVTGDATIQSAVATGSSQHLPMTPDLDLRARGDYLLTPAITLSGTLTFQSAQATGFAPGSPDLSSRVLLGIGGGYKIQSSLEAFAEVANLVNSNYDLWRNYRAPGLELRAGIRGVF